MRAATGLVGRDVSGARRAGRGRRWLAPALLGVLLAALLLAALRIDLLRTRYALGVAWREERALLDERRALVADLRRLRDPALLARRAPDFSLARPERLVEWSPPGAVRP